MPLIAKEKTFLVQDHTLHLVVIVSLSSHFFSFSLSYMALTFKKCMGPKFVCMMFPHEQIYVTHFGEDYCKSNVSFPVHNNMRQATSVHVIVSDVYLNHLVKVVPAMFPQCKSIFSLCHQ